MSTMKTTPGHAISLRPLASKLKMHGDIDQTLNVNNSCANWTHPAKVEYVE